MKLNNISNFPKILKMIEINSNFIYPFMIVPLFLDKQEDIKLIEELDIKKDSLFIAISKSNSANSDINSHYDTGTIGQIMRKVVLPNGKLKILFRADGIGKILSTTSKEQREILVDTIHYRPFKEDSILAFIEVLKDKLRSLSITTGEDKLLNDLEKIIINETDPNYIIDIVASTIELKKHDTYELFKCDDVEERFILLIDFISNNIVVQNLQKEIRTKVNTKMEKINKEYFLKEQIKTIQEELGVEKQKDEDIKEYKKRLEKIKKFANKDASKEIEKQINRLSRMHGDTAEANLLQNYIETALEIPFDKTSATNIAIKTLKTQLELDHYGLIKPKERIVEFFATQELERIREAKKDSNSPTILCFYGPPGVGKTSLAQSIAKASNRKLVKIALGGLEDANELRGHRRTYLGSMCGRIAQGLIDSKTMDPVIILDEIDKIGSSTHRGDSASALLEILDPEQNKSFRDYYLNFSLDLSKVIFIATANNIANIPLPLKDRMELIEISSYTPFEKFNIAKKYLLPQEAKNHCLLTKELNISKKALDEIIENYTKEAGIRGLRRQIAKIARKIATKIVNDEEIASITPENLRDYLGNKIFIDSISGTTNVGIVNGLAYTPFGGSVLKIEAIKLKSKATGLRLTGNLGDVMKESANIAFSVVRAMISTNTIKVKEAIKKDPYEIHLHVPEGATPKDGPSAGGAMALCLASLLSNKKVKSNIALTGELTLSGDILPIGGVREKIIAAFKSKIKIVMLPKQNYEMDLEEVPKEVLEKLEIIPITRIEEILKIAGI